MRILEIYLWRCIILEIKDGQQKHRLIGEIIEKRGNVTMEKIKRKAKSEWIKCVGGELLLFFCF